MSCFPRFIMKDLRQIYALTLKDITLQMRQWKSNVCQLLTPILCMLFILLLQIIVDEVVLPLVDLSEFDGREIPAVPLDLLMTQYMFMNQSKTFPTEILYSTEKNSYKEYIENIGIFGFNGSIPYRFTHVESKGKINELLYDALEDNSDNPDECQEYFGAVKIDNFLDDSLRYTVQYEDLPAYDERGRPTMKTQFCTDLDLIATGYCEFMISIGMMDHVHSEYIKSATDGYMSVKTYTSQQPYYMPKTELDLNLAELMGQFFYPLILLLGIPTIMYSIVLEKETQLKEMMRLMGLKERNYVLSTFCFKLVWFSFSLLLFIILGLILRHRIFYQTNWFVLLFVFFGIGVQVVSVGFFCASFITSSFVATIVGYLLVLFVPLFGVFLVIYFMKPGEYRFKFLLLFPTFPVVDVIFHMCDGCNRYMCFGMESFLENNDFKIALAFLFFDSVLYFLLGLYLEKVSFRTWGVRKHPCFCLSWIPSFFKDCCFMCCSDTWFGKNVLYRKKNKNSKNNKKRRRNKGKKDKKKDRRRKRWEMKRKKWMISEDEDEDVSKVRDRILAGEVGKDDVGILVRGLVKQFGRGARKNVAVKSAFLDIQKKECFGLLGPNGAGKTTLIRVLSGIFAPNRGTGYLGGLEIGSSMEQIRETIGLCPQFTIYWPELTPSEHLLFYSRLKGVNPIDEEHHVSEILEKVGLKSPMKKFLDLHIKPEQQQQEQQQQQQQQQQQEIETDQKTTTNIRKEEEGGDKNNNSSSSSSSSSLSSFDSSDGGGEDLSDSDEAVYSRSKVCCFGFLNRIFRIIFPFEKTARQLSGGMQRRLAIGISLCGDPNIILLDEPTTGLDTSNRRDIWDVILNEKSGRCVILTTHSMEEADVLSDRIAIMSHGRVVAIGSSLHLKQKFGNGYTLHVKAVSEDFVDNIMAFIEDTFSEICILKLIKSFGEKLSYQLLPLQQTSSSDDEQEQTDSKDVEDSTKVKAETESVDDGVVVIDGFETKKTLDQVKEEVVEEVVLEDDNQSEQQQQESEEEREGENNVKISRNATKAVQLRISEVFEKLEQEKKNLGIVDFELNQTTLEDVFLNVVRIDEEKIINERQQKKNWEELGFETKNNDEEDGEDGEDGEDEELEDFKNFEEEEEEEEEEEKNENVSSSSSTRTKSTSEEDVDEEEKGDDDDDDDDEEEEDEGGDEISDDDEEEDEEVLSSKVLFKKEEDNEQTSSGEQNTGVSSEQEEEEEEEEIRTLSTTTTTTTSLEEKDIESDDDDDDDFKQILNEYLTISLGVATTIFKFLSTVCCFYDCFIEMIEILLQTSFLLHKNCILTCRAWKSSCIQICSPFFVVLVMWLVFQIIEADRPKYYIHPDTEHIDTSVLEPCKSWGGKKCYILAYAHNDNSFAIDVMKDVVSTYSLELYDDYRVFTTTDELETFLSNNPNCTQTAVSFERNLTTEYNPSQNVTTYTLYFNGTKDMTNAVIPFKIIVDRSILKIAHISRGEDGVEGIDVNSQEFPHVPSYSNINGQRVVFMYTGPVFFSLLASILFIVSLYRLTMEKEKGLRLGLEMIGMKRSAYICSWLTNFILFGIVMSLTTMIAGYIFQFDCFIYSNPVFMFTLFFLFDLSLILFAFAISPLINRTKTALVIGFIILAISFILNIYIASGTFVYLLLSLEDAYILIPLFFQIFYPPFNFGKLFSDILNKSMKVYDPMKNEFVTNDGFWGFNDLFEENVSVIFRMEVTVQPAIYSVLFMLLNCLIFISTFWYLDSVLTEGRSLCFCLSPFYFCYCCCCSCCKNLFSCRHPRRVSSRTNRMSKKKIAQLDEDLQEEYRACRDPSTSYPLRIVGLKKAYRPPLFCFGRKTRAVKGVDLHFKHHEILGLLGPNGAGKSTLVSSCAGVTSIDGGELFIEDLNRRIHESRVRKHLGVTLQHNILWDDLTAYEHLRLFCQIKGIMTPCAWRKQVKERLKEVSLYDVRNDLSKTFSGGMKRRLSVAMGYIGNPNLILLDEPSTGLDPFSKREVWKLIKDKSGRKECSTLFTTHSMEECDTLSHQIAIMKDGNVKCIGDSMHLKRKYGAGYVLKVSCYVDELMDEFVKFLRSLFPNGDIQKDGGSQYKIMINPEFTKELIHGIKKIEDNMLMEEGESNDDEDDDNSSVVDVNQPKSYHRPKTEDSFEEIKIMGSGEEEEEEEAIDSLDEDENDQEVKKYNENENENENENDDDEYFKKKLYIPKVRIVKNFGLSNTTLEDVYLHVTRGDFDIIDDDDEKNSEKKIIGDEDEDDDSSNKIDGSEEEEEFGTNVVEEEQVITDDESD